ncbi:MAG: glycosyltransferase [Actinobacteria bacterium]|nr:glycosyltransferase [Actinomycetota bacterium]
MAPKISIIMPVYGVEDWVGRAIETVQAQTLEDFEFFAVDDGSPDRSGAICDRYAAQDSRIKVIHKENGGAPSARNAALKLATGSYLYFMDSDDWVEPTMLEDMYTLAEKNRLDLVVSGFFIDTYYSDDSFVTQEISHPDRIYESQRAFREDAYKLFDKNLLYTPWNKLYRGDYIREKNLKFPLTFWDDFPFNLSVLRDVERVGVTSKKYYHFIRARAESETTKYRPDMYTKREEEHGWMLDLYKHWDVSDDASREMILRRYIERVVGCIENVVSENSTLSSAEKSKQVKAMLDDPKTIEAVRVAQPRSFMMKMILLPIKWRNVTLTRMECSLISRIKSSNTKMFATLKAKR